MKHDPRALLPAPIARWLEGEQRAVHRRVDRRLLDPGHVSEMPRRWRPEAGHTFLLESAWLGRDEVECFGALPREFRKSGQALWHWHPSQPGPARALRGPTVFAAATSSTRTVLAWGEGRAPTFLKLGVPLTLASEPRGIDRVHCRVAVDTTRLVRALPRTGFEFCLEPFALVPHAAPLAGLIGREPLEGAWLPFFALTHPSAIRRPARWWRALIESLVDAWARTAIEAGLALELHSQNLLVHLPTGRFGFRDLDGVRADGPFLERLGHRRLVEHLHPSIFRDPDEALDASLSHYLLGGPAAGIGDALGDRGRGQSMLLEAVGARLRVDARKAGEVVARIHHLRARHLKPPPFPRSLARFIAAEQGPNARTRASKWFAPVDLSSLPTTWDPRSQAVFALDALELPDRAIQALGRAPVMRRSGRHLLFVHPFMRGKLGLLEAEHRLRATTWFATPTSSPRSLVVWNAKRVFGLKVSLDVELLGLRRLIHGSKLRRALAVGACLRDVPRRTRRQFGFDVLDEPAALRVRVRDDGQLIRDLAPLSHRAIVPGFGLFFGPLRERADFERDLRRGVIEPLARVAAYLFFQQGLIGQLHQQNVLFGLDAAGRLDGTLVLRDLDSFCIDARVRKLRGLALPRPGSKADLQLAEAPARYDDAWRRSCRADFSFLAEQHGRTLGLSPSTLRALVFDAFDVAFLTEAARHVGDGLVLDELRWVMSRGEVARSVRREALSHLSLETMLEHTHSAWSLPTDRFQTRYSVNALVHALVRSRHAADPITPVLSSPGSVE